MIRHSSAIVFFIALSGCHSGTSTDNIDDHDAGDHDAGPCVGSSCVPGNDAGPACDPSAVTQPGDWEGRYDSSGVWDLSAPVNRDRGLGDVLADLLIEEAVGAMGIPGGLEGQAKDLLESAIGSSIRDYVNGSAPDQWIRQDSFMDTLSSLMGSLAIESDLGLEGTPGVVLGREELSRLGVRYNDTTYDFSPTIEVGGESILPIAATWEGSLAGDTLSIPEHEFALRYGDLILWLISDVIGTDAQDAFKARLVSAVDCAGLLSALGTIEISIVVTSYSIDASVLAGPCNAAVESLADSALGLLEIDSGIVLSGDAVLSDTDCDGATNTVVSSDGYGGTITIIGPTAINPRISVDFTATRGTRHARADIQNSLGTTQSFPLRGRIVWQHGAIDLATYKPYKGIFQNEVRDASLTLLLRQGELRVDLGAITADGEGYIDAMLDVSSHNLDAGTYYVDLSLGGHVAGTSTVELLATGHTAPVIRSDIDKTYLESDFESAAGLVRLLASSASNRTPLAGMPAFYAEADAMPLVFLSGSPRFFDRVMAGRTALDSIEQRGVVLKPFKDIVAGNLVDLALGDIVPELEEQVGYKLYWLLRMRLELPTTTPEILMGDDSEADHVVYSLYSQFLAGDLDAAGLSLQLDALSVAQAWKDEIIPLLSQVSGLGAPAVRAIYIRETTVASTFPYGDWATADYRHHDTSWPLALDFYEEGWLSKQAVEAVRNQMLNLGSTEPALALIAGSSAFIGDDTIAEFHP